jgi:hypothetical protein
VGKEGPACLENRQGRPVAVVQRPGGDIEQDHWQPEVEVEEHGPMALAGSGSKRVAEDIQSRVGYPLLKVVVHVRRLSIHVFVVQTEEYREG